MLEEFTRTTDAWMALVVAYIRAKPDDAVVWLVCSFIVILVLAFSKINISPKFSAKGQGQKMDSNPFQLSAEQAARKTRRMAIAERKLWARKRFAEIIDNATAEEWGKIDPKTGWSLSLEELRTFHRQVARSTGCYDLMPRRLVLCPRADVLKRDIAARTASMKENRANKRPDLYDAVPLPDRGFYPFAYVKAAVNRGTTAVTTVQRKARNKMEELLFSLAKR